jgi:hypothetical protein
MGLAAAVVLTLGIAVIAPQTGDEILDRFVDVRAGLAGDDNDRPSQAQIGIPLSSRSP